MGDLFVNCIRLVGTRLILSGFIVAGLGGVRIILFTTLFVRVLSYSHSSHSLFDGWKAMLF